MVALELVGPFGSAEERDREARKFYQEHRNDCGYYKLTVPKGTEVEIDSFTDDFFEQEDGND